MSLFTNSFRKLSQQQQDNDIVKVYYKTDMKLYAKVRYNRGTTVGQIIDELIKELNLNGKLQYQIYLLTHKKNEPSLGGISIKRKLRRNEQPFKILFLTKVYKFSFYLDYMLSQLSQNTYDSQFNQNENYQFTKYDKEFKIYKITKEGGQKQMKIKINSTGAAICQEGKMEKFIEYSDCKFDFEEDLVFTITQEQVSIYRASNKNEFYAINKMIYQYTKNTEMKYKISVLENKIEHCTKQIMKELESNCYEFTQSKQGMKENARFHIFFDIFKTTQVNKDISAIENDDLTINFDEFRESILDTLSILPTEQFRKGLIAFNSQYKYTASCKIEDQIEEQNNDKLLQSLDNVVISEEDLRRYSQFLS
ncbi:unnamed protein product (macronuclear) [Paramecium tetraurelia]|uniref:Ras-associating domain-containing protein n=1 Tax=Paramecium tetraurelia TaxID=5888 RepID=A0CMN0_PARTE|nr:uncharacterized protein GSPATT00008526001 [Paramecium tetraurelia]CAK72047.1 unnamed protein product [Paramecium tetraurelia]|eukprot:XP_001439444.1 hypothetical protein (macronuclear) [Paramecium tetraurelia strain d4-2]